MIEAGSAGVSFKVTNYDALRCDSTRDRGGKPTTLNGIDRSIGGAQTSYGCEADNEIHDHVVGWVIPS